MSQNSVATTMPPAASMLIRASERRFQQIKLSQTMAMTMATSGVREPVAITAANMMTKPGMATSRTGGRLQVMPKVSQ